MTFCQQSWLNLIGCKDRGEKSMESLSDTRIIDLGIRGVQSRIRGANHPMYEYEGMHPVKNVGKDIIIIAVVKAFERPYRSPKYPKTIPPKGLDTKPAK